MMGLTLDKVQGIVRHVLTGLGGSLVALGITGSEEDWSKIVGAVTLVIGLVWSWIVKPPATPA